MGLNDMDPFTALRISSIFSPPSPMGNPDPNADAGPPLPPMSGSDMSAMPSGDGGQDMNPDVSAMMSKLYQPDTSASDYLKKVLSEQPQAPHPSMWRKILAGALAANKDQENIRMEPVGVRPTESGADVGGRFLGMPQYGQAVQNWRAQLAGAQGAANTERASNANERMAAVETINNILKQQHEMEVERHNLVNEKTAAARTQIQQFLANNKGWKLTSQKGGNYQFVNPLTNETKDTGIPTGTLSQLDELTMNADNAMARAEVAAGGKGSLGEIPDPSDPTGQKKMSVWISTDAQGNPIAKPIKMSGTGEQVNPNKTGPAAPVDNAQVQKQNDEIQNDTRESLSIIDELMGDDNKLKNTHGIGFLGKATRHVPGTEAYNNAVAINRLKAKLTLNLIQNLRAASKSGSTGFGRITNQEVTLLSNAAAQLDPSQTPEKFEQQLALIKEKLNKILLPSSSDSPTVTKQPGTTKPSAADLIKKYGGGGTEEE